MKINSSEITAGRFNSSGLEAVTPGSCRVLLLSIDTPWAARFRDEIKRMGWQLKRLDSPFDALASIPEFDPHLFVISDFHSEATLAEVCDALRIPRLFRPVQIIITTGVPSTNESDLAELGIDEVLSTDEPAGRNAAVLVPQFRLASLNRTLISREQEIFDGLPNPLFVVDSNLTLWKVNRPLAQCLGVEDTGRMRHALGKPLLESVAQASYTSPETSPAAELHSALAQALDQGRTTFRFHQTIDGTERVFSGRITSLMTEFDRYLIDLRDITEDEASLRLEARRERLATIGNLALGVAHEIQNPNTFSRVNAANLEELIDTLRPLVEASQNENSSNGTLRFPPARTLELIHGAIQGVNMASERIAQVLETLRNFGRADATQLAEINPASPIREAIVLTKHLCRDRCELMCDVNDDIPSVIASHTELSQVFVNLIQNAVHAFAEPAVQKRGDGPAKIRIMLESQTESELIIAVSDNGPGIDPALHARIFRPYFTTRGMGEGTGLGLSLSSDIMRRCGGDLTVRSHPGEGATFLVTIPRARDENTITMFQEDAHALQAADRG